MIQAFYETHPMWSWLTLSALLLAAEILTGTGWLLWPTASAVLVALLALVTRALGLPGELVTFAVLTVATTFLGKRFLPSRSLQDGPDINDRAGDLVGKIGKVAAAFVGGEGRVLVDGAEWAAEIDGEAPALGSNVKVIRLLGGAKLSVKSV
jgi:membrane protein implicated in regulation of membrane protease activity